MSHVKFREDLDSAGCGTPGCTHTDHGELYLHARCHPSAGTCAMYRRGMGLLDITCRACERPVATIVVAYESGSN